MGYILVESSRDDMLIPYYNMVVKNGNNISFGRFKGILLEHLANFGRLKNLSLSSNFYLAGAARYYFNGDLTYNKDLALFHEYKLGRETETESNNYTDEWNEEVCYRLNVLILLLRNAHIDSVGTTFEQPEDFGTLSISALLKKYKSKIDKFINKEKESSEKEKKYSTSVGNNYTFEIIYSQNTCKKYYSATSPGAWCITYSIGNYNGYIRRLGIHYIIFKRNDYESVKRVPEREKWVNDNSGYYYPKPQDDYGNSLICVLQSNDSWEPIYITSRWNHGSSDTGPVEADHAYTTDEFMRITGVSKEDLERIYELWKEQAGKNKSNNTLKEEMVGVVRRLKEIQIRINGGESPTKHFCAYTQIIGNGDNMRKGVYSCYYRDEHTSKTYFVLMDNAKLIFETAFPVNGFNASVTENPTLTNRLTIFDASKNYYLLYNYRRHNLLKIDGVSRFRNVPVYHSSQENIIYYEVFRTKNDIAIVNYSTDEPLVLPNGEVWSARVINNLGNSSTYHTDTPQLLSPNLGEEIEVIYDLSSREKYFFNIVTKQYFAPRELSLTPALDETFELAGWEPIVSYVQDAREFFCIEYKNPKNFENGEMDRNWHESPVFLYKNDGTEFRIKGDNMFRWVKGVSNRLLVFKKTFYNEDRTSIRTDRICSFMDLKTKTVAEMGEIQDYSNRDGFIKYYKGNEYFVCKDSHRGFIYNLTESEVVDVYTDNSYYSDDNEIRIKNYLEKKGQSDNIESTYNNDSQLSESIKLLANDIIKKVLEKG